MDEEIKENSKLDTAIGVWNIPYINVEIKYTVKDFRKLRKVIFKKREDRTEIFDAIADYITEELVPKYHKDYYEKNKVDIISKIETNIQEVFQNVMLTFKFSSKEKIAKSEKMAEDAMKDELKNV